MLNNILNDIQNIYHSFLHTSSNENKHLDQWVSNLKPEDKKELCEVIACIVCAMDSTHTYDDSHAISTAECAVASPFDTKNPEFRIDRKALTNYLETQLMCDPEFSSPICEELLALCKRGPAGESITDDACKLTEQLHSNFRLRDEVNKIPKQGFNSLGKDDKWRLIRMLSLIDLNKANLQDLNLSWLALINPGQSLRLDLTAATLTHVEMESNRLDEIKMSEATLKDVNLRYSSLRGADISSITATNLNLEDSFLNDADLSNAKVTSLKLNKADLTGANLSNVNLQNVQLNGTILTGTQLSDAYIKLDSTQLGKLNTRDGRDLLLHHLNNRTSLLIAINSIDNKYADIKLELMRQVIEKLIEICDGGEDISDIYLPLADILLNNSIYQRDGLLSSFIHKTLIPYEMKCAESNLIDLKNLVKFRLLLNNACKKIENNKSWAVEHSCGINQLLYQTEKPRFNANSKTLDLEQAELMLTEEEIVFIHKAGVLRKLYYQALPKDLVGKLDMVGADSAKEKWVVHFIDPDFFIFISKNQETGLVLDKEYFEKNIMGNGGVSWQNNYLYEKQNNEYIFLSKKPEGFLEAYPLLYYKYMSFRTDPTSFLGIVPWEKVLEFDYLKHFKDALKSTDYSIKLIDTADSKHFDHLATLFSHFWRGDFGDYMVEEYIGSTKTVTSCHKQEIIDSFKPIFKEHKIDVENPEYQAHVFFNLAMLFVKYSSSYIFGTENDSPFVLRCYALALLNTACELHPNKNVFGDESTINKWRNKLLGRGGEFECTGMLFGILNDVIEHVSNNEILRKINALIIPDAWR